MLGHDVVSHHSTPDIGSRCPWTPKHLSNPSVLTTFVYHAGLAPWLTLRNRVHATQPDKYLDNVVVSAGWRRCAALVAIGQTRSALITSTKVFDVTPESRVQHAKPVTTRLPKLDIRR